MFSITNSGYCLKAHQKILKRPKKERYEIQDRFSLKKTFDERYTRFEFKSVEIMSFDTFLDRSLCQCLKFI